jgi:hypothetical protein
MEKSENSKISWDLCKWLLKQSKTNFYLVYQKVKNLVSIGCSYKNYDKYEAQTQKISSRCYVTWPFMNELWKKTATKKLIFLATLNI